MTPVCAEKQEPRSYKTTPTYRLRLKRLKIRPLIRVTVRKVWVSIAGGYPDTELFARIYTRLQAMRLRC